MIWIQIIVFLVVAGPAIVVLMALIILFSSLWRSAVEKEKVIRWRKGLCPECGYDIRITPARCSECGVPVRLR